MELLCVDVERRFLVRARYWNFGRGLCLLRWLSLRLLWLSRRAHGRLSWLVRDSRTVDRGHSPLPWHLSLHLLHVVRHRLCRWHVHLRRHGAGHAHLILARRLWAWSRQVSIRLDLLHARRGLWHRARNRRIRHGVCWIARCGGRGHGRGLRRRHSILRLHAIGRVVPHLRHHLMLLHLRRLLVLAVVWRLLCLHDWTGVGWLWTRVRVRVGGRLLCMILRV